MKELTNNDYKRLTKRLKSDSNVSIEDIEALQNLRLAYHEDLSIAFAELVSLAKQVEKNAIVTYRVKRIESIINKLFRQPTMQVNNMSDIAGCRCILSSTTAVYKLYKLLRTSNKLIIVEKKDYIDQPKATGYRSLHLLVKTSRECKHTLEIQIRDQEQHNWATLVEITDLIYKTRIKETGEDGKLAEFHRLLSISYDNLSTEQKEKILSIAWETNYFEKISSIFDKNYLIVRQRWMECKPHNHNYFLISAGADEIPEIRSFNQAREAEDAYINSYMKNPQHKNIVLTHSLHAGFDVISMAYSNYILTYNALFYECYQMTADVVLQTFDSHRLISLLSSYKQFLELTIQLIGVNSQELFQLRRRGLKITNDKKRREWERTINSHFFSIKKIYAKTNDSIFKRNGHFLKKNLIRFMIYCQRHKKTHLYNLHQ